MAHTAEFVVLAVLIAGLIAVVVVLARNARRSISLNREYASEYSRILEETGHRHEEPPPVEPERRGKRFPIKPLGPADRGRYADAWRSIQSEFLKEPGPAVAHADELLGQVMAARGYPMEEFDRRSEEIAADHPAVVRNYWKGHDVAVRQETSDRGELAAAMAAYQALVDELVGEEPLTERVTSTMMRSR